MTASYLGPQGTFTHEAAISFFGNTDGFEPRNTVVDVLRSVESREFPFGVVPIENSVQGEVTTTMDALVFDFNSIGIVGEVILPVGFCAFRKKGAVDSPTSVHSHPHALAQCTQYVHRLGAPVVASKSTAAACEFVATTHDTGVVAIASGRAGEMYGLELIDADIEDYPGAQTRFFVLGTERTVPTGSDKTSFVVIPRNQNRGVLAEIFETLADRSIEVHSIHSRPIRTRLGTYSFFLTISGHLSEADVFAALSSLLDGGHRLKVLGSYAACPDSLPPPPVAEARIRLLMTVPELAAYRAR